MGSRVTERAAAYGFLVFLLKNVIAFSLHKNNLDINVAPLYRSRMKAWKRVSWAEAARLSGNTRLEHRSVSHLKTHVLSTRFCPRSIQMTVKAGIGMGELETRTRSAVRVLVTDVQREPGQERREFGAGHGFQALKGASHSVASS